MALRIVASCIPVLILAACADPPNNPAVNASASNAAYFASPSGASYMPPIITPSSIPIPPVLSSSAPVVPPSPTASATTNDKGAARKTK